MLVNEAIEESSKTISTLHDKWVQPLVWSNPTRKEIQKSEESAKWD